MKKKILSEQFCRMQKLAGIITEEELELYDFDPVRYVRTKFKPLEAQELIDDIKVGGDKLWNYFINLKSEDEVISFIRSYYI